MAVKSTKRKSFLVDIFKQLNHFKSGSLWEKAEFRCGGQGAERVKDATTGVAKCPHTVPKISEDSKKAYGKVMPGVKLVG